MTKTGSASKLLPRFLRPGIACRPSGSRTNPPGSLGRIFAGLAGKFEPIPWVYARSYATWHGMSGGPDRQLPNAERRARAVLELADALSENVRFHHWRTDRVWTRDSGCIFLTRNSAPQGRKPPVIEDANGTAEACPPKPLIERVPRESKTGAHRAAFSVQRLGEVSELQAR